MGGVVLSGDPELAGHFSHMFDELFIDTHHRVSGAEAIEILRSQRIELLIVDVDNVFGLVEVVQSLRAGPNGDAIIIAVGSGPEAKKTAYALGNVYFIDRPQVRWQIRNLLRTLYGRLLHNSKTYFRLNIELPVSIRRASGTVMQCKTINLSQRGLAVRTISSLELGERVDILFAIPNANLLVSVEGTIVWDDKRGKTGISFECKSSSVRARLSDWLSDHFFMHLEGGETAQ
jgi:DNA-binding response OmpR family regulator